jgi:hypothetical protein
MAMIEPVVGGGELHFAVQSVPGGAPVQLSQAHGLAQGRHAAAAVNAKPHSNST